jgi:hypothetical protein
MITNLEKLKCAQRELEMRKRVYPRWVAENKMTQSFCDREMRVMAAIIEDYEKLEVMERLI